MGNYILLYLSTLITLLALDAAWLSLVAMKLFIKYLSHLAGPFRLAPAGIFYLFYVVGILLLVVLPYKDDPKKVFWMGALLGALAYGTYDLTNLATLKDWPLGFALLDMTWGTVVTAITALAASFFVKKFGI